ncbi:MAG TPA: glycosyltransferase family 4 protein [Gaiella sp.]|nr:glycosyltransferase family 4 protein [Gaiella sp.]
MRVVVVSGIWPPDVGGPASHAPALATALVDAGHDVEVVTTADSAPAQRPYPVRWVARSRPVPFRQLAVVREVVSAARRADRVYATTMVRRAAVGAVLARTSLVVKLVADEAFERERRSGRFDGSLEDFQHMRGGLRRRFLRASRTVALRRARHVLVPSAYLRAIAVRWGLEPSRVTVVPNPAPELPPLPSRDDARASLGVTRAVLATAARLTTQKALGVALQAIARVPEVELLVLGDGPERGRLEREAESLGVSDRVRFLGTGTRDDVLALFRAADAVLVTSAWENLPHTVLEALAVGTPVIATAVGGIPEVVVDGENGLLVPPHDVDAVARAVERLVDDDELRQALAAAAAGSVEELSEPRILRRIVDAITSDGEDGR